MVRSKRSLCVRWDYGRLGLGLSAISMLATSACSLTVLSRENCASDAECRSAFGLTSVCAQSGFCEPIPLPPRCRPFPAELEVDPVLSNAVIFGVMYDSALEGDRRAVNASVLAADLANQNGGIYVVEPARPFGLVICDYRSDLDARQGVAAPAVGKAYADGLTRVEAALETSRFLVERLRVPAVVGPMSSTETDAVFREVARLAPSLVLSPGAMSAALADIDVTPSPVRPGFLWRTAPPDDTLISELASSLLARSIQRVFVVAQTGLPEFSAGELQTRLAPASVSIATFAPPETSNQLIEAVNAAASSSGTQEVVFLGDNVRDALAFLQLAVGDPRFDARNITLCGVADDPALLALDDRGAFGPRGSPSTFRVRVVRFPQAPSAVRGNFNNYYQDRYALESPLAFPKVAAAWDAAWLLMFASARAQVIGGGIAADTLGLGLRALSDVGRPTTTPLEPPSWRGGLTALTRPMSGEEGTLNVEGASGSLDYDLSREELVGVPEVSVIVRENGAWTFAKEPGS